MNISAKNLSRFMNDLIYQWQKKGLLSDTRQHSPFKRSNGLLEVTWRNEGYVLKNNNFATFQEYVDLIENRQYSALMANGDFFQISYSIRKDTIVKHRLCWYPCPIEILSDDLENGGIIDALLDRMSGAKLNQLQSKGPVRFDYDSLEYSEEHPEIHLHMIDENCRIPVKTPLCLRNFFDFIFRNFYSHTPELVTLNSKTKTWNTLDRLTDYQRSIMHLNIFQDAKFQ